MAPGPSLPDDITLYVIRHGETDWNAELRYQGQADVPLNANGRAQATRNGEALAAQNLDLESFDFIASPLIRARETMELVRAALAVPRDGYQLNDLLKELSYGHWQGLLQSDLPRLDPDGVAARSKDPYHWRPKGGESYADLVVRTATWLEGVQRNSIIAAHGGTLRCLHQLLLGSPEHDVPLLHVPQDQVLVIRGGTGSWI